MAQLEMYWKTEKPKEVPLPTGFSVVTYSSEADIPLWVEICKAGLLHEGEGMESFETRILSKPRLVPERDLFFLDYEGRHVATAAAFLKEDGTGYMHMVGSLPEVRGKGVGNYLSYLVKQHLYELEAPSVTLSTDEFRKAAVKAYLTAGFLPIYCGPDMEERWSLVLKEYGIPEVQMVNEDGSLYKIIKAEK